jgi:hypothetical protein
MRYHVKNNPLHLGSWIYEAAPEPNVTTAVNLLARILIAKVDDEERLVTILEGTPVDPEGKKGGWRCRCWIEDVLGRIKGDGRAVRKAERLGWVEIEPFARRYVAEKTASGRYERGADLDGPRPTWDLLEGMEIVS